VPERRIRTRQEREAARLERERRRAIREGRTPPPAATSSAPTLPAASPPEASPPAASPPEPPSPEPEPVSPGLPVQPARISNPGRALPSAAELEADELDDEVESPQAGESESESESELEPELELPSGTRRVSHLDKPVTARSGQPRKVRRRRRPREPRRRRPRETNQRRLREGHQRRAWVGRIASVLALLVGAAVIWFLIALFQPFQGSPQGQVTVRVPAHSPSSQIGALLARDGVISSSLFFEIRATLAGERGDLRPGTYHLQRGMSYGAVLAALTKVPPAAKQTELTITEGKTRQAISQLLRGQHIRGNYLAATRSSPLLDPRRYGLRHRPSSLEGFLFPDTFKLVEPITVPALVSDQLTDFKRRFAAVTLGYARRQHLTAYDVLKVASLIEAEAATAGARPLVASVIYNRLADGMLLQLDSTTRYATGNFTRPLTVSQLRSRSPYNTHTHLGLPPTPIDNPGLGAIQAAAHPARSHYLFFFAKPCSSSTVFASTYSEFLNLLRRDRRPHC